MEAPPSALYAPTPPEPTADKLIDNGAAAADLMEDVGRENLEDIGDLAGPAVRLYYFDPVHYIWYGSVLVACHTKLFGEQAPLLNYKTSETDPTDVVGEIILNHAEWSVVRFRLRAVLEPVRSTLEYSIRFAASDKSPKGTISLPNCTETWHIAAYSCSDQRQKAKTGTAAWAGLRLLHETNPLHVVIGGGDQLYNDNIWKIPAMKQWASMKDKEQMRATPLTAAQEASAEEFYFFAYVRWLANHPLKQQLACIPMLNTWDDHDIFDGWGSYPPHLQNCSAFGQVFRLAKKMYAAFQMHTTVKTQKSDGYFTAQGDTGLSWMSQLGPKLAVAAIDTRSSRTRENIIAEKLVETMLNRIRNLPSTVKHLLFVSAVPVQYTELQFMEKLVGTAEGNSLFSKTGLMKSIMNDFGEPELLDDLLDHWSSTRHVEEKGLLLNDLRNLAAERRLRITIVSGDVHLAAYAFCASSDKYTDLAADPGFIPQVISSAIAYDPVGWSALAALDKASGFDTSVVYPHEPKMYGGMGQLFKTKKASSSARFANRNNFLEMEVHESRVFKGVDMLKCTFHVRASTEPKDEPDLEPYVLEIPPLVPGTDPTLIEQLQEQLEHTLPGRGTIMRKVPVCGGCFAMCGL